MLEGETVESLEVVRGKVGLVLGLPMGRKVVRREWALALATVGWPIGISVMHMAVTDRPVSEAREIVCDQAVAVEAPYIWFLDDDTVPTSSAIRHLSYALDQNPTAAVCGGIYCGKTDPPSPMVFKEFGQGSYWDWKIGEVFEVSGIGTGCMLVRTAALKNIPKPWFRTIDVAIEGDSRYIIQNTDDIYFCKKVLQAGYKILAHGGVVCDHWDMNSGKVYSLPKDSRPYELAKN